MRKSVERAAAMLMALCLLLPGTGRALALEKAQRFPGGDTEMQTAVFAREAGGFSLLAAGESPVKDNGSRAARYRDRMDLPDYAGDFYDLLERETQPGGALTLGESYEAPPPGNLHTAPVGSVISADLRYSNGSAVIHGLVVCRDTGDPASAEWIGAAYAAFQLDHPEVFWLSGRSQYSMSGQNRDTILFHLKSKTELEGSPARFFDLRLAEYQTGEAVAAGIDRREKAVDRIFRELEAELPTTASNLEKAKFFNHWLTHHNGYSTAYPDESMLAHRALCALEGSSGTDGPVCEGYAKAFKVLCDRQGIDCVLERGDIMGQKGRGHMWNSIRLGDGDGPETNWYGVDVTWNDPTGGASGAVSGHEGETYFMVGENSQRYDGSGGSAAFGVSHPAVNAVLFDQRGNPSLVLNGPRLTEQEFALNHPLREGWQSDSGNHWQVREGYGRTGVRPHTPDEAGRCTVCGRVLSPAIALEAGGGEVRVQFPDAGGKTGLVAGYDSSGRLVSLRCFAGAELLEPQRFQAEGTVFRAFLLNEQQLPVTPEAAA